MLILLALIIVSIGGAIVFTVYSLFNPFIENMGDIKNYNIAYYGAISSLERGNLALRYRDAGFEGSGGWTGTTDFGPNSDHLKNDYGRLATQNNSMYWEIKSREGITIPSAGDGNVDLALQYTGTTYEHSKDYNKLGYNMIEEFILTLDDTNENDAYSSSTTSNKNIVNLDGIDATFRLPPYIKDKFSGPTNPLCTLADCDLSGDGIDNDIVVNWDISGKHNSNNFSLKPSIEVSYAAGSVGNKDTAIRETHVNNDKTIEFYNSMNPTSSLPSHDPDKNNIIPSNHAFSGSNFDYIFSNTNEDLSISFSLVNLLATSVMYDSNNRIYPFLEYKIKFDGVSEVPARFYNISGIGEVGEYQVKIIQRKPTSERNIASDFTILF
ncbi:hypothetical protein [Candidatus Vampirococcus lugosii]|uniref:Uncharacterized protein n=1 Tax=Candidatus Vampirococcus lugosii TaxID=2789015 RepID=A0ABS5QM13_9BACT|nr:hypothetical protein [Candidatus Vampirococcus lugosii]MBS8122235.1 hypothetical protein [Candidatus Vampirococcus lugosii]